MTRSSRWARRRLPRTSIPRSPPGSTARAPDAEPRSATRSPTRAAGPCGWAGGGSRRRRAGSTWSSAARAWLRAVPASPVDNGRPCRARRPASAVSRSIRGGALHDLVDVSRAARTRVAILVRTLAHLPSRSLTACLAPQAQRPPATTRVRGDQAPLVTRARMSRRSSRDARRGPRAPTSLLRALSRIDGSSRAARRSEGEAAAGRAASQPVGRRERLDRSERGAHDARRRRAMIQRLGRRRHDVRATALKCSTTARPSAAFDVGSVPAPGSVTAPGGQRQHRSVWTVGDVPRTLRFGTTARRRCRRTPTGTRAL